MRNWLISLRNEKGLPQGAVSKKLNVSQAFYCRVEQGKKVHNMTYLMMEKLATALEVPVQTIIDAEKEYAASIHR